MNGADDPRPAAALEYHNRGYAVTPLAGKKPVLRNWPHCPLTREQIEQWQGMADLGVADNHNLGVVFRTTDRLVGVDVDCKHRAPGMTTLAAWKTQLPGVFDQPFQITPSGGLHFLWRVPADVDLISLPNGNAAPGIEVYTRNHQFVLSPSFTEQGRYRGSSGPIVLPPISELPAAPRELIELLQSLGSRKRTSSNTEPDRAPSEELFRKAVALLPNEGQYDGRDEWLRIIMAMKGACEGTDFEEIGEELAQEWCAKWPGGNDPVYVSKTYQENRPKASWHTLRAEVEKHTKVSLAAEEALAVFNGVPLPPVPSTERIIRVRTLAEIDDSPPADLLLGMCEPDGQTLLYAAGGTGKGSTLAYAAGELIKLGIRPLIYDAEDHPKEWARRTAGLGIDRSQIAYVQPRDLPKELMGRPLWDIVPYLGRIMDRTGSAILFVDSILAAAGVGEERLKSDAQAPYLLARALDEMGRPSVTLGHTPKGSPEGDPYGSVAWVNAARLTWLGTAAEGDGHVVRWRPRKRNERGYIAPVRLAFEYADGKRLSGVVRSDDDYSTKAWLLGALAVGPRSVSALADELIDTFPPEGPIAKALDAAKERLGRALRRLRLDGLVVRSGSGPKVTWGLSSLGGLASELEALA